MLQYAMNTSDVNGLPGKSNFPVVSAANSPEASANDGGGGLHDHDHDHEPTEVE